MRRWLYALPGVVFALMTAGFYVGLYRDQNVLPSPLINDPAPQFSLPPLPGNVAGFSTADLKGHVTLVNAFASWCVPCRVEQPVLNALAATKQVPIYGIDYKDDDTAATDYLKQMGNPYTRIGTDTGRVGIDWGVYGVPESFLVDATGRIRYKHVGPLSADDLRKTILPLIARLDAKGAR